MPLSLTTALGKNRVGIAISTKDRAHFTAQMLPGLDCGGFDLIWCDGSVTPEGRAFADANHFSHTPVKGVWHDISGGPDAAIKFCLNRLLSMGYDYVGLIENDIALKPGWLQAMVDAWGAAEQDGFEVGAVTVRSACSRVYAHSPRYVVQWNMGAAMVLFSRAAAEAVLADYHTPTAGEIHRFYQGALGIDLSDVWELFMDKPDRNLGADWLYAASVLKRGMISVGTIPHLAENIDVDFEEVCGTEYIRLAKNTFPAHCLSLSQLKAALASLTAAYSRHVDAVSSANQSASTKPASMSSTFNSKLTAQKPVIDFATIVRTAISVKTVQRVCKVYETMEPSAAQPPDGYRDAEGIAKAEYCSAKQILSAVFELTSPRNYLEIGTRRGHSLCLAVSSAPVPFDVYSFDMWIPNYGGEANPGPDLVRSELAKFGFKGKFNVSLGDSQETVPAFFANKDNPQLFDVIYVDGDHTDVGARRDLENTVAHLAPGGYMLFDDITHPKHLTLLRVWEEFVASHPELEDVVETRFEYGWALARRRHAIPANQDALGSVAPVSKSAHLNGSANGATHGTMGVNTESAFAAALKRIIAERRPRKLVETGTHVGAGTTTIIASALRENGLDSAVFHSIEVNPVFYLRANQHLRKIGLDRFVRLNNGLSIPRQLLPTGDEIKAAASEASTVPGVFIDHHEARRVALYLSETNFDRVEDDLLGRCLAEFDYKPDLVLLDSAGHMGFVEFQYVIQFIKSPCVMVFDDVNHLKHYLTLKQIRNDARFKILCESNEKYGFCIAEFQPVTITTTHGEADAGWIRDYLERMLAPVPSEATIPTDVAEAYARWKNTFPANAPLPDARPIEALAGSYPQHGEFYIDLGIIVRASGRIHHARRLFEHAVRLSPKDVRGWQELARYYYCDVGNSELAFAICKQAMPNIQLRGHLNSVLEQKTGFHSWEGDYCWLDGNASLLIHTGQLSFPSELEFTLTGADAWCYGGRPVPVTISSGNTVLKQMVFTGNQHSEKVVVPLETGTSDEAINIHSSVAFVPSQITHDSQDTRRLAVRISGLNLHPKVNCNSWNEEGLKQFLTVTF